jgi:membrane protein DedA with SNARE-associated domain
MRNLLRPLAIVSLVLLVPVLPLLIFGDRLDRVVETWLDPPPSPAAIAAMTVALLSSDIFLPIPSSLVSTFAGSQLGILAATAASWLGMTLGAAIGFALAKIWGRPLAARFSSAEDLARIDRLGRDYGVWMLIATRPLPLLAEAAVLLAGLSELSWRWFLPCVMLSNFGIALVYSILGRLAYAQGQLLLALAASIALPLLATTIARRLLRDRPPLSTD